MLVNIVNRQRAFADVTLVVINDIVNPTLLESIHPDVEVIRLGRKVGSHNPLPLLKLNTLLLRLKPTAIHCHSYTIAGYLLPSLRRKAILTMHTTFVGSMRKGKRTFYEAVCYLSAGTSTSHTTNGS